MTNRKFKDRAMQKLYDLYRRSAPTTRMTELGSAYYRGMAHPDMGPTLSPRGSLAYAAWAAGVDTARQV